MSMYSQVPAYHQTSYPVHGYPPQPPFHAYPTTSTVYPVDPSTFRRDYSARLAELTENSRPVIQGLSLYAQDYSRWADVAVSCIESHIRRVPPWMKLPAFYLIDAISKNVYEPFAPIFGSRVSPLFLDSYNQVDPSTRTKMEEMLLTWRTGGPNGRQLFGAGVQSALERQVWGSGATPDTSRRDFIAKAQVLSELNLTLNQTQQKLLINPFDTEARNTVAILQQLRSVVEEGVSQKQLMEIRAELHSLARPPPPPSAAPVAPASYPSTATYPPPTSYTHDQGTPMPPSVSAHQTMVSHPGTSYPPVPKPVAPSSEPSKSYPGLSHAPSASGPVAVPNNISSLLDTLAKAGWGSSGAPPVSAGTTAPSSQAEAEADLSREAAREYREVILSENVKFTSTDITKTKPNIVRLLYDRLPVQCKQCGIRFPDTTQGKKTMDSHFDVHFRQNRKASQNLGRGHSRSWFVGVEDWVHDISASSKGKESTDPSRPLNAKVVAAAEGAKRDAELRAQSVVVPPGDEAKHIACPICKESLKSEFNEDDEEWVWRNAVKAEDGRIFHATCHADALSSLSTSTALVARLRQGLADGSRSGTPDALSSRVTPPRTMVKSKSPSPASNLGKRKVDTNLAAVKVEDGTPPSKKLMLSATA
ncbi:hypothetical protein FA95DRAFT_1552745 [Auriscalpium vulgare]|uniref:Uncharacterized protein n=1 Tax=Auriscalpium vulgare TaxID=40419 RepID=A0ACB8S9S3_9AGAM|nr:hypothetical protein FA95DRAFT_1552745 [Auriscalpium vulgare]